MSRRCPDRSGYLPDYDVRRSIGHMRFRVPADELECAALERLAVKKLLGSRPRATVAALVEAVDPVDPLLLDELERAVAARRRSRDGT